MKGQTPTWTKLIAYAIAAVIGIVTVVVDPFHIFDGDDAKGVTTASGSRAAGHDPKMCNPDPPEYPGCTNEQINNWEIGTLERTQQHYRENRWGQSGFTWANLSNAHDDKLRRLYGDAVERYQSRRHAQGVFGSKANPRYLTWNGFKAHTECVGGGPAAALWSFMCRFGQAKDDVIDNVTRIAFTCETAGFIAGAGARLAAAMPFITLAPEAVPGIVATGVIACMLEVIAKAIGLPVPKASQHDLRVAVAAARARFAAEEALGAILPFGAVSHVSPTDRLLSSIAKEYRSRQKSASL